MAYTLGGQVVAQPHREYGLAPLTLMGECALTKGLKEQLNVWMSHGDAVKTIPAGFQTVASSGETPMQLWHPQINPYMVYSSIRKYEIPSRDLIYFIILSLRSVMPTNLGRWRSLLRTKQKN